MNEKKFFLRADCGCRLHSFGEACSMTSEFLSGLRDIHPEFRFWQFIPQEPTGFEPVADDWHDLDACLRSMIEPDEDAPWGYTALDSTGRITAQTTSVKGFQFKLYTSVESAGHMENFARADHVDLTLHLGGARETYIQLNLPGTRHDLLNDVVCGAIVRLLARVFDPVVVDTRAPAFEDAAFDDRRVGSLVARWLTYLRHRGAVACLPESLPCPVERIGEDAVLFKLGAAPLDGDDEADLAVARDLQDVFDTYRFDHDHVLYGWPPYPPEEEYIHQVTGAPPGLKYTVAFTDFDGYDSRRKVLLYARLFGDESAPLLEYGLDPDDEDELAEHPVVAQARQQLAALDHVGADTPIEWHVGDKAHAKSVARFLNKWARIPASKVKVVFTPFKGTPRE